MKEILDEIEKVLSDYEKCEIKIIKNLKGKIIIEKTASKAFECEKE
ncbi:hypothetical protein [uncultured Ilyobacter sp.]|nr:hypothetical protein [uncultured Ilyobacter sp.]